MLKNNKIKATTTTTISTTTTVTTPCPVCQNGGTPLDGTCTTCKCQEKFGGNLCGKTKKNFTKNNLKRLVFKKINNRENS